MSEHYVCWDPDMEDDPGLNPPASNIIETAYDAEAAAAEYAEREWDNGDPYDSATFSVRDQSGIVHVVEVTVDYSPNFYGSRKP